VSVLFERGNFDAVSTIRTANTVMYYSIGLFAYSAQQTMTAAFYAIQDTRTPFKLSAISIVIDTVLGLILMWPLREGGLALSTAVGGIVNFSMQLVLLNKKIPGIDVKNILSAFAKISGASVAMGVLTLLFHRHIHFTCFTPLFNGIAGLAAAVGFGIGIYAAFLFLFRIHEIRELIGVFRHSPAKQAP
jgi:putative peptidoglycan lipid II flippase